MVAQCRLASRYFPEKKQEKHLLDSELRKYHYIL
jgi:hypothetical protein